MKTCYIVSEYGGDYGEYYETPIKVFLSEENAKKYIESHQEIEISISPEEFQKALKIAWNDFPEDTNTPFPELIIKTDKFPEWSLEELSKTDEYLRRKEDNWMGFIIKEIELCQ